ncbi:hypothetical protein RF683_04060 [Flavobacterium sp. 20NA77.7]|uniref:Uncharacterized protein n=1 Tax=Flavobacterium nakdongensis TaxID=3073563 RepID=A0ABY9RE92_9FLAO|nr:hypothetical protein [Flavobacterium sp. 20NA77.7]WMW78625.1 hypothetical protein RF683_04060 [Flavobacterium sp. 20NA77.7]
MKKIIANTNEITLYCFLGEALLKIQIVEQALSYSITIKMNPDETKEKADAFLKKQQRYTLGTAIKIAIEKKFFDSDIEKELSTFIEQRNWLVHNVLIGNEEDFNSGKIKEALFQKIKSISDKAESIQYLIENDIIEFCSSKGQDMSKIKELLQLQEKGIRVSN